MTDFRISITRNILETAIVTITGAKDRAEAEELALAQSNDLDFSTDDFVGEKRVSSCIELLAPKNDFQLLENSELLDHDAGVQLAVFDRGVYENVAAAINDGALHIAPDTIFGRSAVQDAEDAMCAVSKCFGNSMQIAFRYTKGV